MLDQDASDMEQVRAGRLDRFACLVERHQSGLFRYARSKLGARVLAEDAVQEAFLAAFQSRSSFDPKRSFRGWIWAILVNVCRRLGKKEARGAADAFSLLEHDLADAGADAETPLEQLEQRRQLGELLERLPAEQADAVRMRFFGELSFDEIGEAMSCSPATAKSRVRYGLAKMAELLKAKQETAP